MVRKIAILLGAVMGLHFIATAQNLTISGSVTDQGGYPLEGATVMVKGTANGTVTDAEGNYRISASGDSELIVSYLGYLSQVKSVNGGTKVDFVLQEEMTASPAQWVCTVCGYVHEGDAPPEVCPLCKVPAEKFERKR